MYFFENQWKIKNNNYNILSFQIRNIENNNYYQLQIRWHYWNDFHLKFINLMLNFNIHSQLNYGDAVYISGNSYYLGNWNPK